MITGLLSPWLRHMRARAVGPEMTGRVLDYGCAEGALVPYCVSRDYTGVDIDKAALADAARAYPHCRFISAEEFAGLDETFDSISLLAVIGLVEDKVGLLNLLKTRLADNGKIIVTTPHPFANGIHRLGAMVGVFANDGYAQKMQVDIRVLNLLAKQAGLRIKERRSFMLGMNQIFILARLC